MPAANGSRIGIQFVSYLLPCTVVDVAVTENEPLIRILYGFYDRPYLLFQTDKGVNFLVDGVLQIHDLLKAPYKGGFFLWLQSMRNMVVACPAMRLFLGMCLRPFRA